MRLDFIPRISLLLESAAFAPSLRNVTERFSQPLSASEHTIIQNLIGRGWTIRKVRVEGIYKPSSAFFGADWQFTSQAESWQIELEEDGFIRVAARDDSNTLSLDFFHILPEKQGQGFGRKWFPRICDELFQAGASALVGMPCASTLYKCVLPISLDRLTAFYVREGGFRELGNGWIRKDRLAESV